MQTELTAYINPKLEAEPRLEMGGYGVFAKKPIRAGELLTVWGGRIVNKDGLEQLPPITRRHAVQVEEDLYLAPIGPAEPADFFNHSCSPNSGMSGQIALVAMRDIATGEEVCFDYAMCDGSPYDEFECACGSSDCRKKVTGNDWQIPHLWEQYAGFFSPFLQRRIDKINKSSK